MQAVATRLQATFAFPGRPALRIVASAAAEGTPHLPHLTPRQLVLIRLGDEVARQTFVDAWLPVVGDEARRYAFKGGAEDDLIAEGSLALWEAVHSYDAQGHRTSPERYIANQVHRRIRRAYGTAMGFAAPPKEHVQEPEQIARTDDGFTAAEQRTDLRHAMRGLKPVEREQFGRYLTLVLGGLGPDEAARTLADGQGESFAACKKRLERIRSRVKQHLAR